MKIDRRLVVGFGVMNIDWSEHKSWYHEDVNAYVLILDHNIQYRTYDVMDQADIGRYFLASIVTCLTPVGNYRLSP
jgi:hypothetical protein